MGLKLLPGEQCLAEISKIIVHCSATPNGLDDWGIEDIDSWHHQRQMRRRKWARGIHRPELKSVAYHFVILTDGTVEEGRGLCEVGAHARPENTGSVGICLMGTDSFSARQWTSLKQLVRRLCGSLPAVEVVKGHRDVRGVSKRCPGFDVAEWLRGEMAPLPGHIS